MTTLVKNTDALRTAHETALPARPGFGPLAAPAPSKGESLARAVTTMLLVLYPAMASAAAVIAALVYSGAQPIV